NLVGLTADPHQRIVLKIWSLRKIGYVGWAEPINDRSYLQIFSAIAKIIQAGVWRKHSGDECKMSACGMSGENDLVDIDVIRLCVLYHPPQRAAAIFDGGWSN